MQLKYDLHTHILPGVDDGAVDKDETLILLDNLRKQGIKNVCLTPHFYTHKESTEDFLLRRNQAYNELRPFLPEDMNIKLGAEVYVTKYLFAEEIDVLPLCIEGTPYMITEFNYESSFTGESMRLLIKLRDRCVIPVIPHVERYPKLMKDKSILSELIYMGVIVQSNFSSFTDPLKRRKLVSFIKSGYIHVLATDVHSMTRNSPQSIPEAMEFITKKCSLSVINKLNQNAEEVFNGI